MKNKIFDNILYRIILPPVAGFFIYLVILLIFDRVNIIADSFLSSEYLFVVGITYTLSEFLRLNCLIVSKYFDLEKKPVLHITFLFAFAVILSIVLTSLMVYGYFVLIENFTPFKSDYFIFNFAYLLMALSYNTFYLSVKYLDINKTNIFKYEQLQRKNSEIRLQRFLVSNNIEFLYDSMEILIEISEKKAHESQIIIEKLSDIYRYSLNNQFTDIILLKSEIENMQKMVSVYNIYYSGSIQLTINSELNGNDYFILPGTLLQIFQKIKTENIISPYNNYVINLTKDDTGLVITYTHKPKIQTIVNTDFAFNMVLQNIEKFTNKTVKELCVNNEKKLVIPLILSENIENQ